MLKAKKNRFLLKVFIVRHVVGLGMVGYLALSAYRLEMPQLALGSLAALLLYLGVGLWMGARILKDIRRQEGRA